MTITEYTMVFNCTYLTFYVLWMCVMISKIDVHIILKASHDPANTCSTNHTVCF